MHKSEFVYTEMSSAGVQASNVGLEPPYQLGTNEREGGVWKTIANKMVAVEGETGMSDMRPMASEINAAELT